VRRVLRLGRHGVRRLECYWALGRATLLSLVLGFDRVSVYLARLSKDQVQYLLKRFGAEIGEDCDIESQVIVHHAEGGYQNLHIGSGCHIGKQVFLDLAAPIEIGDRVTISMRATILTHIDVGRSPLGERDYPPARHAVHIRRGAYIGAGATILPGVEVGECAVVGAGAVVTKNVNPREAVTGVPARFMKYVGAPDEQV
jgi:acetyltransferase-like isoleucine patch superfamily enzyme